MAQQSEFEETCERYLLGELSDAEQERFEESYFADDTLFERLQAVKADLLDAGARGELAGEKKARFAGHFLVPAANRRELDETRRFIRAVTAVSAKTVTNGDAAIKAPAAATAQKSSWRQSFKDFFNLRPFVWQIAFAAVLLVALAGTWIFVRNWRQATPAEQAAVQPSPLPATPILSPPAPTGANDNNSIANDNEAPTPAGIDKLPVNKNEPPNKKTAPPPARKKPTDRPAQNRQPERAKTRSPENERKNTPFNLTLSTVGRDSKATASVTLSPVAARDLDSQNTLELLPVTENVRLQLIFNNDEYRRYAATVTTLDGAHVWRQRNLKLSLNGDGTKSVTLRFASALLLPRRQDYIVTLKGITAKGQTETIGEYYLRVARGLPSNVTTRDPSEIPGFKRP